MEVLTVQKLRDGLRGICRFNPNSEWVGECGSPSTAGWIEIPEGIRAQPTEQSLMWIRVRCAPLFSSPPVLPEAGFALARRLLRRLVDLALPT